MVMGRDRAGDLSEAAKCDRLQFFRLGREHPRPPVFGTTLQVHAETFAQCAPLSGVGARIVSGQALCELRSRPRH